MWMTRRRRLEWNKATMALAIMGVVMLSEVIGVIVLSIMDKAIPAEYMSFMYTTLTVLAAVAGAQYVNGKTANS